MIESISAKKFAYSDTVALGLSFKSVQNIMHSLL